MLVRDATPNDIGAITELFNVLIPTTTVTWRDEPSTEAEQLAWLHERDQAGFPTLVADDDGRLVGYCCCTSFRGGDRFPGYRRTVELSVHVRGDRHGQGIGRTLLTALIDRARRDGIHVMVAAIDADNVDSIRFHASLGFAEVARMPEVGHKFGRWLDLVLMQRILDP